ncbi:MAG: type III pantothenate kinase [Candidatus Omnitrophica bacterium]|nr:type III pantothenate kinase [Candidatus Omnitrophota bacterium]
MILVDAGNTNLHFVLKTKDKIIKEEKIANVNLSVSFLNDFLARYSSDDIVLCSVVPKVTELFKKIKRKVYLVGEDLAVPVKSCYDEKKVGMDRLVVVYAAIKLYPLSRLVIDFGTAITFDFISSKGVYQGGLILPGLGSTLDVLSRCALLPATVKFRPRKGFIPTNTTNSIVAGIEDGFSSMLNGVYDKYSKRNKFKPDNLPIITGGDVGLVRRYLKFDHIYDRLLVFKGLSLLSDLL